MASPVKIIYAHIEKKPLLSILCTVYCVPNNLESIIYDAQMGPDSVLRFSWNEVSKAIYSLNTGKAAYAHCL